MGLAERERAAKPKSNNYRGSVCNVEHACLGLDQEDADALHRLVMKRLDLTAVEVEEILAEEGIDLPRQNITRHRRGECRNCKKKG